MLLRLDVRCSCSGLRSEISTTFRPHEISHFTFAVLVQKSNSFTWARGNKLPRPETVTQSPILMSQESKDFRLEPSVNMILQSDAMLQSDYRCCCLYLLDCICRRPKELLDLFISHLAPTFAYRVIYG